jgi:hypothetical protein
VHAEVAVVAQFTEDRVRDGTDAGLDRGAVGDALGDEPRDPAVLVAGVRRFDGDTWLTWIVLPPNVRGMWALTSRKNGARPMKCAV